MNLIISEDQLKALVEKWRAESDALSRSGDYGRDDMLWRIADELTAILATAKRMEVDEAMVERAFQKACDVMGGYRTRLCRKSVRAAIKAALGEGEGE